MSRTNVSRILPAVRTLARRTGSWNRHGRAATKRIKRAPATSNLILRPLARFIAGVKGHPRESVNARGKNDGFL